MSKTIIVLGFQRSGTSTVAGVLNIMGVDMGPDKIVLSINPNGSFEDQDFVNIGKDVIKTSLGKSKYYPYDVWFDIPSKKQIKAVERNFQNKIKKLIKNKSNKSVVWGFKYPETHLMFDLFIKYIKNPHLVIIYRNPIDVVNSADNSYRNFKNKYAYKDKVNSVIKHMQLISEIPVEYKDIPTIFLTFDDLINNPVKVTHRMASFLDLELDKKRIKKVKKFVIPRNKIKFVRFLKRLEIHSKIMARHHKIFFKHIIKYHKSPKKICSEIQKIKTLYIKKYLKFLKRKTF